MTLKEITERLRAEFPGQWTSFVVKADTDDPGGGSCVIQYENGDGALTGIPCHDLEEGIAKLKEQLHMPTKEPFTIEIR